MDQTTVGVFFQTGDKVRLTRDYGYDKLGRIGKFIQYVGNDGLTLVEMRGGVHLSVWAVDLEKVYVKNLRLFQAGDRVRLTRKYGQHKKGDLATFVQYYSDPGEATVQFDGGTMPFDQVPVAWLQKVKEA